MLRYVELNPVRARTAREATAWEWSSAQRHAGLSNDGDGGGGKEGLLAPGPMSADGKVVDITEGMFG